MTNKKVGRNTLCLCGSGKKYKKCCLSKDEKGEREGRKTLWQLQGEMFVDLPQSRRLDDRWEGESSYGEDFDDTVADGYSDLSDDATGVKEIIENEEPALDDRDEEIIDQWNKEYLDIFGSKGPGNDVVGRTVKHITDFMDNHPQLVDHLELHYEVLLDLGDNMARVGRHGEYVDLLLRIRHEFPETYRGSSDYFVRDIISHLILTGRSSEIETYANDFLGYRQHEMVDQVLTVMDLIMLSGEPGMAMSFFRGLFSKVNDFESVAVYMAVTYAFIYSHLNENISPNPSSEILKETCEILKKNKIYLENKEATEDLLIKDLLPVIEDEHDWDVSRCLSAKDVWLIYRKLTNSFMYYLMSRKNFDWTLALFFKTKVSQFIENSIPDQKRPRELVFFNQRYMSHILSKSCIHMFSHSNTCIFGMQNGLWYFAEYLFEKEMIDHQYMQDIQRWCRLLYEQTKASFVMSAFESQLFKEFPFRQ